MPIDLPIIGTILHPPVGLLTPLLDTNGPYPPGKTLLTSWNDSGTIRTVDATYGVMWQQTGTIPPYLGFTLGFDNGLQEGCYYEHRTIQLVVQHQMFGGFWAVTQIENSFLMGAITTWSEALPGRLGLYIAPYLYFNLYFLRAL